MGSGSVGNSEIAVVRFHDPLANRQAEAGALSGILVHRVHEGLECGARFQEGNAWSIVGDLDLRPGTAGPGAHLHLISAVPIGIVQNLAEELLDTGWVGKYGQPLWDVNRDFELGRRSC